MHPTETFNASIFDNDYMAKLAAAFNNAIPIRHTVIDNFLSGSLAREIFANFPSMSSMNTHYKGINEKKAEHSNFAALHASFDQLHEQLASPDFIHWLQQVTGVPALETINDRLGYGLHQGADKSFLDIHIDYNLHPIKKIYRKLNLIIFFNPDWQDSWGGHLELWDRDVKKCVQRIAPVFNRCVIFECSDISYHGYSRLDIPEGVTRKSMYQYYFIPVTNDISFHDTIFKPRPEEKPVKKMITYSKDFAKNQVKKILVKLGWKRFLE